MLRNFALATVLVIAASPATAGVNPHLACAKILPQSADVLTASAQANSSTIKLPDGWKPSIAFCTTLVLAAENSAGSDSLMRLDNLSN
jgi:hypothetical protein